MSVSNDNVMATQAIDKRLPQCSICEKDYEVDDVVVTTPCNHIFHKTCIVNVLKDTLGCPMCGKACRPNKLRSYNILGDSEGNGGASSQNIDGMGAIPKTPKPRGRPPARNVLDWTVTQSPRFFTNPSNEDVPSLDNIFNTTQTNVVNQNVQQNVNENMSDSFLRNMINEAVRNQLSRINVNPPVNSRESLGNQNLSWNQNRISLSRYNNHSNRGNQFLSSDKISSIISGWHVRFSGQAEDGLSVDNFIYRIQALTNQSLRGDFELLCRHIHLLFTGKAVDWFWRFHRATPNVNWEALCVELRKEFKDRRTDFDLREQLRARKQKFGEKFDSFYESILQITDCLQTPIREDELVEILRRNLRPEIRKDLLHFRINNISDLREYVRRNEILEEEISRIRGNRNFMSRKVVSELESDIVQEDDVVTVEEIKEVVCWNCSQNGHKFKDCLGERKIFCYGCGSPNVFKPNCSKCNRFPKNYQSNRPEGQLKSKATQY